MQLYQEALSCAQEVQLQLPFIVQRCFASLRFASLGTNDLPGIGRSKWPEPQRWTNTMETDAILAILPKKKPKHHETS